MYGHPSYIDIEGDVQGIHIVRFTIEKDGELTDIEHLRSLGAQLNTVVDTIVKDMSAAKFYTAGVHNGDTVRIRYMLPLQIVPHNGEGVFPDPAYRVFESDFDYVESLGISLRINSKKISEKNIWRLSKDCEADVDLKAWMWSEEDVSFEYRCP